MRDTDWQSRTALLLGEKKLQELKNKHILIAGLGGVGSYAAEQLCRAGIGKFTLADNDVVQETNRNRQLIALTSTEGMRKTELIAARMKEINPDVKVTFIHDFLNEKNIPDILNDDFDYIVDAIDTLSPKVTLMTEARLRGKKIISSFGSGGRMDPTQIRVTDISDSYGCKFGIKIRKELHKRNIREGIRVVFSPEPADPKALEITDGSNNKRSIVGTISYMPAMFGCYCAAEVIRDLLND